MTEEPPPHPALIDPPPPIVISTGIAGLDAMLGGGVRLLMRDFDASAHAAVVLVRGGPGAGKTVIAAHLAAAVAADRGADALFACTELLPTELCQQLRGFDATRALLPMRHVRGGMGHPGDAPRAFGLLLEPAKGAPRDWPIANDVERNLKFLEAAGANPRVVVVDALSEAYGTGASFGREAANALAVLAVARGCTFILIEETGGGASSPWPFVSDTVIEFPWRPGHARTVTVTKNRFGPAAPGSRLVTFEGGKVEVGPERK